MSHGSFSGDPQTLWLTEDKVPDRKMQMLADFSFTDPAGVVWLTPENISSTELQYLAHFGRFWAHPTPAITDVLP